MPYKPTRESRIRACIQYIAIINAMLYVFMKLYLIYRLAPDCQCPHYPALIRQKEYGNILLSLDLHK